MRNIISLGIIALLVWACSSAKDATTNSAILEQSIRDSTEYELIIIDPYFDQWYLINYSDAKDRSNEYYRSKILIAVIDWNEFYRLGRYDKVIDSYIHYESHIDYGIELNRRLYWYFKYVREKYGIKLGW